MNNLIFGRAKLLMEETPGSGGGNPPEPPKEPTNTNPPPEPPKGPTNTNPPPEPPKGPTKKEPKSALGDDVPNSEGQNNVEKSAKEEKVVTDEEYIKALTVDEETKKVAGEDKIELSQEVIKTMLPVLKEANISPEAANKLANAFARTQIAQAQAYAAEQLEALKTGSEEARKLFPEKRDWDLMRAARDHFFKPANDKGEGGAMLYTIAKSGLGNDPEFLALLKFAGEHLATDTTHVKGGVGPGGNRETDYAKALGFR